MKVMTVVFWSLPDLNDGFKHHKRIRLIRAFYATLIVFACIVSFIALVIVPSPESREGFATFVKVVSLLSFFVFITDWIGHLITYRYLDNNKHVSLFKLTIKYIFSFSSIVIILCILSSAQAIKYFLEANDKNAEYVFTAFSSLGLVRIVRLFMVLSLFSPFAAITNVFVEQKKLLTSVFFIIIILIILFALIIWSQETVYLFNQKLAYLASVSDNYANSSEFDIFIKLNKLDPASSAYQSLINKINHQQYEDAKNLLSLDDKNNLDSLSVGYIKNFGEAFYFTTITLTTVGYGDFSPHAPISRVIVSFISLLAIAIVAIPSGVIAGAFLSEMQKRSKKKKNQKANQNQQNQNEEPNNNTNCENQAVKPKSDDHRKKSLDDYEFIEIKF
ncbi:potassium channel family protein [Mycoplasma sp. E35C]|uniref:potassium channel family protein n=1 Tax=Mycoplasma sp. E35C TaxID=2801918 RepID=UPI0021039AEE|nr:potassium channel family protein [Mycoplasma sp. E35C]